MSPSSSLPDFLRGLGLAVLTAIGLCQPVAATDPWSEWNRRLHAGIEVLEAGDAGKARRTLDQLLDDYLELAGTGQGNEANLGTLLVYRAIAEFNAGEIERAKWDWDVATSFLPETSKLDLSRFGDAGKALLEFAAGPAPLQEMEALYQRAGSCKECNLILPTAEMRPEPRYTYGARYFQVEGVLIVRVIVDEKGRVSRPAVLRKISAPGLTFSAIEALRKWKFEPARLGGRPISYFYTLTINYSME